MIGVKYVYLVIQPPAPSIPVPDQLTFTVQENKTQKDYVRLQQPERMETTFSSFQFSPSSKKPGFDLTALAPGAVASVLDGLTQLPPDCCVIVAEQRPLSEGVSRERRSAEAASE